MLNKCVIDAEVYDYCDNQAPTVFQSLVYGSLFLGEKWEEIVSKVLNSEQQN